jgi:hypothetical protein
MKKTIIRNITQKSEKKIFKSNIEEYFSYYLEELKDRGFIKEWFYEKDTFDLSESISKVYLEAGKKKSLKKSENLMHKASITADFTIIWDNSAENIFYLNREKPISVKIKRIPFRLSYNDYKLESLVETKGSFESTTSSSISFPYKQKWLYFISRIFIQKVRPFKNSIQSDILFQNTFTPKKVINSELYRRNLGERI